MKKLLYLSCAMLLMLAACSKEEDQPSNNNNGQNDANVNLVGRWDPTSQAWYKVMLYYEDGTFCDSLFASYEEEEGFVFSSNNQVETPWGVSATYSMTQDSIFFNLMGVVTRGYKLLNVSSDHLAFERMDIGEYTTGNENGGTDTLVGYEYDHWDLRKVGK